MSEFAATLDPTAGHESDVDHDAGHDWIYVKVAALLAVLTAIEIVLPEIADIAGPTLALMLVLMVVKFVIVVAYFMHLKFDSVIFRRVFAAGVVLAVLVYVAALTTFSFWEASSGEGIGNQPPPGAPPLFPEP